MNVFRQRGLFRHVGQGFNYIGQRSISRTHGDRLSSVATSPVSELDSPPTKTPVKPFSEMPGPKGLPVIGSLLDVISNYGKGHLLLKQMFDDHGPIWKMKIVDMTIVYLKDVGAMEKMHRLEGKYPRRISIDPWVRWREANQHAKGILITDGPEWKRMRTLLDKRMMRPKHVATYLNEFNEVVTDFIDHIRQIRNEKGGGVTVPHLDDELFHWSLETIGTVLYETRFGSFGETRDPSIAAFIDAVHGIFRSTEKVIYFPPAVARVVIPKWYKMHKNAWQTIFGTGKRLIDTKMEEIQQRLEKGEEVDGFLPALIKESKLTGDEIYANISELMLGAVDTTSNTMQWVLHRLSEHPAAQAKLYEELVAVTGGEICNNEHLQKLPYLKAFIKEVLRLYPIAGVTTRVLNEDMELAGYHLPKDTTVLGSTFWVGRDPDHYEHPEAFLPERWLRTSERKAVHNFAWLPFGFGPRMCVGRRVAELEMYLLTARIVQQFQIEPVPEEEPVTIATRGLVVPSRCVNVKFIDRQ